MIADLQSCAFRDREYDVCVVGSGPAGLTLAAELARAGRSVCVLESGGRRPTRFGDGLRVVRSEGIAIKDYSRERVLGGASTTWAGLSSPLDEVDFERRTCLRLPGWPFGREELVPYWRAAAERYRFAPLEHYQTGGFARLRERGELQPRWENLQEKVFLAAAEPQDFGRELGGLFEGQGPDLALGATVVGLRGDAATGRVVQARTRDARGDEQGVAARTFVLAAGGIENARLLLLSRDLCPAGLGNEADQVGRGLMNHPKNYHGILRLERPVRELPYFFGCLHEGYAGYAGLRLADGLQRERGLLNAYVRLEPLYPWSDSRGVEAFVFLAKRCQGLLRSFQARRQGRVVALRDYSETGDDSDLQNARKTPLDWLRLAGLVLAHALPVSRYALARLREGAAPSVQRVRLRNFMEMEPDPDNRVLLGQETDALGLPVPVVRHRCTELDRRSLVALHEVLADELRRTGLGVLESHLTDDEPWPIDQDASHHLGTTRMGLDPATSVVDQDLRLHGVDNVYLAGGSVFPTSGCANPTLTIVALSIRLARHLTERLQAQLPGAVAP